MIHHNATGTSHLRAAPTGCGRGGDGQLGLDVSPTLRDRLAREAAERGMRLEDWAVLKLGVDAGSRAARVSLAHARPVPPWQTRC